MGNFTYRMLAKEWAKITVQEDVKGRFKAARWAEKIMSKYDCMSVACGDASDNACWERELDDYKAAFLTEGGGST